MKKKIIVLLVLVLIIAACFIPVSRQETISVKSPFLNIYRELILPANWAKWRADFRKNFVADSAKMMINKGNSSFSIKYGDQSLNVVFKENVFTVNDTLGSSNKMYTYTIVPEKDLKRTSVLVDEKMNVATFLASKIGIGPLTQTHIGDLKQFMETDSLLYGCTIIRTKVPDSNLIVIDKRVLAKNKYSEAAKMLSDLQQYIKTHDVRQVRPIIAQFLPKGKDSSQLKVGIFINKEVKSEKEITYMRMPLGGTFYIGTFKGKFNERSRVYTGMHQYFTNHLYQLALIPFETYLDNKLPVSDTDKVNVQVIFPSYF